MAKWIPNRAQKAKLLAATKIKDVAPKPEITEPETVGEEYIFEDEDELDLEE